MAEVSTNCSENQRIETVYEMDTHYYIFSPKGIFKTNNSQMSKELLAIKHAGTDGNHIRELMFEWSQPVPQAQGGPG